MYNELSINNTGSQVKCLGQYGQVIAKYNKARQSTFYNHPAWEAEYGVSTMLDSFKHWFAEQVGLALRSDSSESLYSGLRVKNIDNKVICLGSFGQKIASYHKDQERAIYNHPAWEAEYGIRYMTEGFKRWFMAKVDLMVVSDMTTDYPPDPYYINAIKHWIDTGQGGLEFRYDVIIFPEIKRAYSVKYLTDEYRRKVRG